MKVYYTYNFANKRLVRAPRTRKTADAFIIMSTDDQFAEIGAYPRAEDAAPPTPPHGKIAVFDGYALEDMQWTPQYRFEPEPPPPPRTFSKLKLEAAIAKLGKLAALDAFLATITLAPDFTAARAWNTAQTISESYPNFAEYLAAVCTALGIDDKKAEAILAASVAEGGV